MNFSKLDLDLFKSMQDEFSLQAGVSVTTIDMKGNEILISGKRGFFFDLINKKSSNMLSDVRLSKVSELKNNSYYEIEYCDGLYGIAFPIVVLNNLLGLIIIDGIKLKESPDCSRLALDLGIDKEELDYALEEIKIVDLNVKNNAIKIFSIFSKKIPELCYKRKQDERRVEEMTTLSELIKMINSSLDLESTLRYIMNFMVNNLMARDCSILVDSEEGQKRFCMREEGKSLSVVENAIRNKMSSTKSYLMIDEVESRFGIEVPEGYSSIVSFPLKLKDDVVGALNVYGSRVKELDHYDLEFLSTVSSQAAIAVINATKFEEVKELAVVDKLTSVYNRRYFMTLLEKQLEKDEIVSLILTDIDDFGKYNNTHGHPQGDELLKEISELFKNNLRADDIVGRYGGEEFIMMIPKLKTNEAAEITKRIKEAVEDYKFEGGETQPRGKVTVSLGLVTCMDNKISSKDLIKEADDALYKAKKSGKNQFVHTVMIKNNLKADTFVNHKTKEEGN